jgi:hypothetical protein
MPPMPVCDASFKCVSRKLGTSDVGPTTQTLICPKGQAFVEGKCVDNIEQPPSMPPNTTTPAVVDTTKTATPPPAVASGSGAGIPTWALVVGALGVAAFGWHLMNSDGKKRVKRNGRGLRKGQVVEGHVGSGSHYSDHFRGVVVSVHGDKVQVDTGSGIETTSASKLRRVKRGGYKRNGKIIASSFQRYNGGVRIKRLYGSSTVTRFYVFREEDRNDASKWLEVEGFGPTPGDRKTDAIRRSGLK